MGQQAQICVRLGSQSVLLLFFLALLPSCVALTSEGEKVRVTTNPDVVRGCRFIQTVSATSGWGGSASGTGTANTEATLRNRTAKLGGNTLFLAQAGVHSSGEAYDCPTR
jgi:hypothetical protein